MVHTFLPPGDYTIRPKGAGVEIITLDRDIPREEVAVQIGRTERSLDLYRNLEGPAQLKSNRIGGRVYIKASELTRWLDYMEAHPHEQLTGDRPRKKRRPRLAFGPGGELGKPVSQEPARFSTTA